jgi:hypothetical protein
MRTMAWILRLDQASHARGGPQPRPTLPKRAGLGTAFIPRPTEHGPRPDDGPDVAESDWELVCVSIPQTPIAGRLADANRRGIGQVIG